MAKCKDCDQQTLDTAYCTIFGVCLRCAERLETAAVARGITLLKPPVIGEPEELQILGVKLWFWRGHWRAS